MFIAGGGRVCGARRGFPPQRGPPERHGRARRRPTHRRAPPVPVSAVRIGDLNAWRAYQTAVFERTEALLLALAPWDLETLMFDGVRLSGLENSFLELMVPAGSLRRGDLAEAWIYQHGIRHLGELEHARALVGLGGLS